MTHQSSTRASLVASVACLAALTACRDVIDLRTGPASRPAPPSTTTTKPAAPAESLRYQTLLDDPLGDGATTANLFLHDGLLFIGPSATGDRAVRVDPAGDVRDVVTFAIDGDGANKSSGPYASFGFPGCQPNTAACGPDNENASASLTSAVVDGREVLVAAGGKGDGGGAIHDVYFGSVDGGVARFAYLDVGAASHDDARGVGVVHQDRLQGGGALTLALHVRGPGGPRLLEVLHAPGDGGAAAHVTAQCDPARGDVCELRAVDGIASLHAHEIDAVSVAGNYTFLGAAGGVASVFGALADAQSKSAYRDVTPIAAAYALAPSIDASTSGPVSSRPIAGFAAAGDDVVFGRNTTLGAQLWSCAGGASSGCAPEQWTPLDGAGDATNARVSAVWSTGAAALIALDDPAGIRLYRYAPSTNGNRALVRLDGVDGLGTRILASLVATLADQTWLYALVADDAGAPRLVRVLLETPPVDISG